MDMYLTSEDCPHINFLVDRGYEPINENRTKWKKYLIYVGFSHDFRNCLITRRNKNKIKTYLNGKEQQIYDVMYRGKYPFDVPDFATLLFDKLRLNYIPTKKKQYNKMVEVANQPFHDEEEDIDVLLNY